MSYLPIAPAYLKNTQMHICSKRSYACIIAVQCASVAMRINVCIATVFLSSANVPPRVSGPSSKPRKFDAYPCE